MNIEPTEQETLILEAIWRDQSRPGGPALDFTKPEFKAEGKPASAQEVTRALGDILNWPEWMILFPKPAQAVVAVNRLLKSQGCPGGVVWVAPGTGAPFEPPHGEPGLAMLRTDWAPDRQSPAFAQDKIRARDLYLIVDESHTGLRLAPGGACEYYGLAPDAVFYGPSLAGGRDFAALAGRGPAPASPAVQPSPEALTAMAATLGLARSLDIPARLEAWGRALALGLAWFAARAKVADKIAWEGPLALPRLDGKRIWAFMELCREEGLDLASLVFMDPTLEPTLAGDLLWPRLCRAAVRLKALPEGEKAPHGWSEAHGVSSCQKAADIFGAQD